jgi:hypothetical protein
MNLRFLAASLAVVSAFAVGSKANALSVTTPFVNFKAVGTPTTTNVPSTLSFANFASVYSGPGTLKKVRWVVSPAAIAGGNPRVTNTSTTSAQTPLASNMSYALSLTPFILGTPIAGGNQNPSSLNCTAGNCTNSISQAIDDGEGNLQTTTKTYTLAGTYSNTPGFAGLTPSQAAAFTGINGGTVSSSYAAIFQGGGADLGWVFNQAPGTTGTGANLRPTVTPFIEGLIALQYEYDLPPGPGATVPGPLPLVGAAAAFGWSRRLKNRISSAA